MYKFVRKIIIFLTIVSTVCFFCVYIHINFIKNQYEQGYNASIIDKIALLENTKSPKIILVGNSNLSFGIDSEKLSKEMKMPVINLGLHGSLGNRFHEDMAKFNIDKGDIIVICHSDYSDNGKIFDYPLAWITLEWHKNLWTLIPREEYVNMLSAYPKFFFKAGKLWIKKKGNQSTDDCYSRLAFNNNGDVIFKPTNGNIKDLDYYFSLNREPLPKINSICVDRINEFDKYVKEKGAHLLIAGYPIAYGKYASFKVCELDDFEKNLRKRLNCPVISKYRDYLFPYSFFYNGRLHLNVAGTQKRTELLVKDLRTWNNHKL